MKIESMVDYENELNSTQLEAVRLIDGPCLVIAGAGSGKTRILVYRVAHLVESGVDPKEILLLTFTRKVAKEMLTRAESLLDSRCNGVSGGTFHSFANMVLRRTLQLASIQCAKKVYRSGLSNNESRNKLRRSC